MKRFLLVVLFSFLCGVMSAQDIFISYDELKKSDPEFFNENNCEAYALFRRRDGFKEELLKNKIQIESDYLIREVLWTGACVDYYGYLFDFSEKKIYFYNSFDMGVYDIDDETVYQLKEQSHFSNTTYKGQPMFNGNLLAVRGSGIDLLTSMQNGNLTWFASNTYGKDETQDVIQWKKIGNIISKIDKSDWISEWEDDDVSDQTYEINKKSKKKSKRKIK